MEKEKVYAFLRKLSFDEEKANLEKLYSGESYYPTETEKIISKCFVFYANKEKRAKFTLSYMKRERKFVLSIEGQKLSLLGYQGGMFCTRQFYKEYEDEMEKVKENLIKSTKALLNEDKNFRILKALHQIDVKDLSHLYLD